MARTGAGGYWRGDRWIEITWGEKIRAGLAGRKKYEVICQGCGEQFDVLPNARRTAKWCSHECRYRAQYTELADPVLKKAKICGANLVMGKGKLDSLVALISAAIGKPCVYCETIISLENLNVDHKTPLSSLEARRRKAEFRELRRELDVIENLQVICKDCNSLKLDMSDDQYRRLLRFLDENDDLRQMIFTRFRRGFVPFKRRRAA